MLLAFAVLVALYLLYSQVYAPMGLKLSSLRAEVEIARRRAQTTRQAALGLSALELDLEDLQRRLDSIWLSIGQEPDMPLLVRSLEAYSQEAGARLLNLRPQAVTVGKRVAEMPFELTLQGSFESILAFLRQAEEGSPAVVFTGMRADALKSDTLHSPPELNAVISGKTYFRTGNQAVGLAGGGDT